MAGSSVRVAMADEAGAPLIIGVGAKVALARTAWMPSAPAHADPGTEPVPEPSPDREPLLAITLAGSLLQLRDRPGHLADRTARCRARNTAWDHM